MDRNGIINVIIEIKKNIKFDQATQDALVKFKGKYTLSNVTAIGPLTFAYLQYAYEQNRYANDSSKQSSSDSKFEGRKQKLFPTPEPEPEPEAPPQVQDQPAQQENNSPYSEGDLMYDFFDPSAGYLNALYDLAYKYSRQNVKQASLLVSQYIRRKYDGFNFKITVGQLDQGFINYVDRKNPKIKDYFSNDMTVKDPVSSDTIDFPHLAATLNAYLTTSYLADYDAKLNDVLGFAGDLHKFISKNIVPQTESYKNDYNTIYKKAKELLGNSSKSNFDIHDMLADVDAVNIAALYNQSDSQTAINKVIQDYYSQNASQRYRSFVSNLLGKQNLSLDEIKDQLTKYVDKYMTRNIASSLYNQMLPKEATKEQLGASRDAFIDYIIDKIKIENGG